MMRAHLRGGPTALGLIRERTVRAPWRTVIVSAYDRALVYRRGVLVRALDPGAYRLRRGSVVRIVDVRPRFVTVPGQELLTADGVTLRLSLAARFRVADVRRALEDTVDFVEALYLTLQLAVREIVGSARIDELLEQRASIAERLSATVIPAATDLGIEVTAVDVKDLMFPGDLKRIFAQTVAAQREGVAALERARAETAALRHLANTGRLLSDNPALLQLRAIQELGASQSGTLVLGLPTG